MNEPCLIFWFFGALFLYGAYEAVVLAHWVEGAFSFFAGTSCMVWPVLEWLSERQKTPLPLLSGILARGDR